MRMATEISPATDTPLHERIARFSGSKYDFLMRLLERPERPAQVILREDMNMAEANFHRWRWEDTEFKAVSDAIREHKDSLKSIYAKALFEASTAQLAQSMVARGVSLQHKDGQRACERILETVGVLPKPGIEVATPTQINTFTYYLVGRDTQPQPFLIETTAKELPAPEKDATNA